MWNPLHLPLDVLVLIQGVKVNYINWTQIMSFTKQCNQGYLNTSVKYRKLSIYHALCCTTSVYRSLTVGNLIYLKNCRICLLHAQYHTSCRVTFFLLHCELIIKYIGTTRKVFWRYKSFRADLNSLYFQHLTHAHTLLETWICHH